MTDSERRSALLERSKRLRSLALAFSERLADPKAKEFMRAMVFNHLDDVEALFLGDPQSRPSTAMWEATWLDSAETMLRIAEDSFETFQSQVQKYGGPENVRLIG